MPPSERDSSREGESRHLRHQHSASSDQGNRALVPMWDSSDPDRAPPPLPLNPQSPSSFTSRTGTSSAIQSAHAALNERARESSAALVPAFKRVNDASPERSSGKGGSHRRMQSLQPGTVRDLSLMIEGTQSPCASPTRSPEKQQRPSTPTPASSKDKDRDVDSRTRDRDSNSSTPTPGPSLTPIVRPTVRRPHSSILGENTPPQSSTMLALQNMSSHSSLRDSEPPLSNITNGSTAGPKTSQSLDGISTQILSLTSIATALQKEMAQLSRRSRDNATDLLSLKEVTNMRDEDIRKSLRDLLGGVNENTNRITSSSRDPFGGLYLDNKPHSASPANGQQFQLPRIPSLKSFSESIDRGNSSTPSPENADGAASLVLLEKIISDMGTKDGQESLLERLAEVSGKLSGMATSSKVDELADFVRSQSENAIIPDRPRDLGLNQDSRGLELDYSQPGGPMTQRVDRLLNPTENRRSSAPSARGSEILNEDLIKIIRSVKDSVAQGGGLTAEVKALVRELRGEVLGMGREIDKRLEQVDRKGIEEADTPSKDDVSRVIDEGLEQMKEQLNHVLREHRRQSAASVSSQKTLVDYQEIYNAMRAALRDNEASGSEIPDLSRDDVIEAVRDAWENYKPEIEVQQLGLEREEVLACLKEGLQEYVPPQDERPAGASREEVFMAVVEGLKHFVPPQMDTSATLSRDEIIEAVRDCLEEFEFPIAASAIGTDNVTREDMLHAVKEGLDGLELPRGGAVVASGDNEEIMSRLQDLMGYMQLEFKAVSEEAKDNVAANGRDTEQVLDATKDGLENLRVAIEGYVDRVSGVAGQEEFMDDLLKNLDDFKDDLAGVVSQATVNSREQLQTELEGLREMVTSSMVPATPQAAQGNNKEVLEALQSGVNSLRQEILRPRPETGEILDALNDGLNELRAGIDRMTHKPVDLTANDEILDALKAGLDSVKSDIETLRDSTNERAMAAVATVSEVADNAVVPAETLKQDDIRNLEVMITQLAIKVEAMEPESDAGSSVKEDQAHLEEMLRNVQESVDEIKSRAPETTREATDAPRASGDAATRDDIEAVETILRNTKARLDDLIDGGQAVRKEQIDVVETLILETRETMTSVIDKLDTISHKEDVATLEALVGQIALGFEEMKTRTDADSEDPERVTKTDVEAVETVVLEIKTALDGFTGTDFATISNKEDIANIEVIVKEAKEKLDEYTEVSAKASEDRQAEIVGVGERVSEVRTFLEEFQEAIKVKLEDGSGGVEALGKLLETIGEKMDKNETVGEDLKEMFDTMKNEFDDSKNILAGAKLESDEKLQEATDTIGIKIDDKITELIAKYDEFQVTLDEKSKAGEARDIETEAAILGTKAIADELKLLIDTLGSTVTDSLEKMEEASKTVFTKVEDLASRTDENHTDHKTEHQQTRDQVQHAISIVEGMQGDVKEVQPQILEAVKDILLLVGEHFEHSKSSTTDIQDRIVETKASEQQMLPPPDKYDDSEVREQLNRLVEQKYDDSEIRERLNKLAEEKYDDAGVHEKLDRLVDHTDTAQQAFTQLDTLDKVHESVVKTAADISEFLSNQTQRIADNHEDREKTLQETIIALERRLVERDHLEASILSLKDEEERVRNNVVNLRTEQESLIRQKTRLTGDVSSLETAMRLRKEELSDMEGRAEGLERRILEGVMDHSRVLLMSKTTKGRDTMNRKRVKKSVAEDGETSKAARPAVNFALTAKRNSTAQPGTPRRIVSLSQMTNNVPSGGMQRSQSVRTPAGNKALRKRSWGGDLGKGFGEADKENQGGMRETLEELDEPDTPVVEQAVFPHGEVTVAEDNGSLVDDEDQSSDAGTLRRTSNGTTVMSGSTGMYTESEGGYSEYDDTGSEWTESAVGGRSSMAGTEVGGQDNEMVVYGE